jgi:hypothetical protein
MSFTFDFDNCIYVEYKDSLCNNFFENIEEFYSAYHNRNVIKMKSGAHYFFVILMYILGLG